MAARVVRICAPLLGLGLIAAVLSGALTRNRETPPKLAATVAVTLLVVASAFTVLAVVSPQTVEPAFSIFDKTEQAMDSLDKGEDSDPALDD